MLTPSDFKKLHEVFATKAELHYEVQQIREEMATKEDLRQFESRILTILDKVLGELKIMREEFSMHSGGHQRMNDDIDDLQTRVAVLEGN